MKRRTFAGLDVVVENEAGSVRQWHDREAGRSGETVMRHDYGFLDGHVGVDGDEVDCYLGPDESAPFVYVIHQRRAPDFEKHDEDKVMLGFASEADAKAAYLAHRDDGERAYGGMTALPLERFKAKLQRRTGTGVIRYERSLMASKHALFEARRGADGKVRAGVWDLVCLEGYDEKDGQATQFTPTTLGQMIDNFVERGDLVPVDWNHQSNYAAQNGQPAPALAWYGALALVWDGKVMKTGAARDVTDWESATEGLDFSTNGLFAYRAEVTELGNQLLTGFKYLSPTFTPDGTRRDGSPCGYQLLAVAATNTPWQSGTSITFSKTGTASNAGANNAAAPAAERTFGMNPELLAKLGLQEGCSSDEMHGAFARYMAEMEEKMAKMAEPPPAAMDAADGDGDEDEDDKPAAMEAPADDKKDEAKMAVMEASLRALQAKLEKFEKAEKAREAKARAEQEQKFSALAEAAVKGGYPAEAKDALIKFARSDFDAASKSVAPFLAKAKAPAYLFENLTEAGAPKGQGRASREDASVPKPRKTQALGRTFVEVDSPMADEIKRIAFSKEPALAEKVDKLLPEIQRGEKFYRLLAADKIVRAERPDLVEASEQ